MGCEPLTTPSKDFDLKRPSPELEAVCTWPGNPEGVQSVDLRRAVVAYAASLADCAERKAAVQAHYERQRKIMSQAF